MWWLCALYADRVLLKSWADATGGNFNVAQ